jgi:predicted GNAT superfamily acetyltransferase
MVFHKAFGFKCVGTQQTEDGEKEVKLLSLDLNPFN